MFGEWGHCNLKGPLETQLRRDPGSDVGMAIEGGIEFCQCISHITSLTSQPRLLRAGRKLGNLPQVEVAGSGSQPCLAPQESAQ